MVLRPYWISKIKKAWEKKSIVWLSGVRRVGKTTIAKMFENALYMNCDLPSVIRILGEPEFFFRANQGKIIIFDEIHRLEDSTNILKIAADEYPDIKILATGSSTLAATKKFRDSLTGRKTNIYLPPVLWNECIEQFSIANFDHRLLNGGLPEQLMATEKYIDFFTEWMDSYYARDIQELFGIRSRQGFLKLLQLVFKQSGGLLDYTHLSRLCELSRPTVKSHIEAMSIAHAIFLLPPFHGGSKREITKMPKLYGFDTGFVTFVKGWESIRDEDRGLLWEHLVLDFLRSVINEHHLYYWRDKSGREIDFVFRSSDNHLNTIECKINPDNFSPSSLQAFRELYPAGKNYCVNPFIDQSYIRKYNNYIVEFIPIKSLLAIGN